MKISLYPRSLLAKIAVGYAVILLIIGSIIYTGIYEWKERKVREQEVRQISSRKQEIHDVYVRMLELSSFSETFIEWETEDLQACATSKVGWSMRILTASADYGKIKNNLWGNTW